MVTGKRVCGPNILRMLAVVLLLVSWTAITHAITYDEKMEAISNAVKIYNENRRAEREAHNEEVRRTGQGVIWKTLFDPTSVSPGDPRRSNKAWDPDGNLIYDLTSSTNYVGELYRGNPPETPPEEPPADDPPPVTPPDDPPPGSNPPGDTADTPPEVQPPLPPAPVLDEPPLSPDELRKIMQTSLPDQLRQVQDQFRRIPRNQRPRGDK